MHDIFLECDGRIWNSSMSKYLNEQFCKYEEDCLFYKHDAKPTWHSLHHQHYVDYVSFVHDLLTIISTQKSFLLDFLESFKQLLKKKRFLCTIMFQSWILKKYCMDGY